MKKYEYKNKLYHIKAIGGVCFVEDRYDQEMNKLGKEGWEIFQVDMSIMDYEHNGDLVIIRMRRKIPLIRMPRLRRKIGAKAVTEISLTKKGGKLAKEHEGQKSQDLQDEVVGDVSKGG